MTNVTPSVGIMAGMPLYAIQGLFPQGTVVLSVNGSTVTMSQPAQVTQTGAVFEISGLINFQWRSGTPDNPSWTDFIRPIRTRKQGYSGIVRVYGPMPRIYSNMLRATYVAGFPVDWQNAGNGTRTNSRPISRIPARTRRPHLQAPPACREEQRSDAGRNDLMEE